MELSEALKLLLVASLAATPYVEIMVAIPVGIAMGLHPFFVFAVAVMGNLLTVVLLWLLVGQARQWFRRRFLAGPSNPHGGAPAKGRSGRFHRFWRRYGLPGTSLAAPATIGSHLAVVLALLLGSSGRLVLSWMTLSLVLWGVAFTGLVYIGWEGLRRLF